MLRLLAALSVAACVSSAGAEIITYVASLSGSAESPPNASPATGFTTVTVDTIAQTMRVQVQFQDLLGPNTACHIHVINGPGDGNTSDTLGPVATTTPTFVGFPTGAISGTYDNTLDLTQAGSYRGGWITDSGGTTVAASAQLLAGIAEGRAYLNVHSSVFPGGEIRGFLQVPEPASLTLLLIAGVAGLARRRA